MHLEFVNDWRDEDFGLSMPDPIFVFNAGIGICAENVQVSLIIFGIGFVLIIGEQSTEDELR